MRWIGQKLYDAAKDRRYGTLFIFSIAMFVLALILTVWLLNLSKENETVRIIFPVVVVFVALWAFALFKRAFFHRTGPAECAPLSQDELIKARAQLRKSAGRR